MSSILQESPIIRHYFKTERNKQEGELEHARVGRREGRKGNTILMIETNISPVLLLW